MCRLQNSEIVARMTDAAIRYSSCSKSSELTGRDFVHPNMRGVRRFLLSTKIKLWSKRAVARAHRNVVGRGRESNHLKCGISIGDDEVGEVGGW